MDRIGPRKLIDIHADAGFAIEPTELIVLLRPEFDAGHVSQSHDHRGHVGCFGIDFLDHDIAKLLGGHQAAKGRERNLKRLLIGGRLLADIASGNLKVLIFQRQPNIVGHDCNCRHLFWIQPDSHAVVALPEEIDIPHAINPQQFIANLNGGVVRKKCLVIDWRAVGILLRREVDDHHRGRRFLEYRHSFSLHELRQDRHG